MPAAGRPWSLGAPRTGAHHLFQQSEGEARQRQRRRELASLSQILVPPARVLDGLVWVLCVSGFRFFSGRDGSRRDAPSSTAPPGYRAQPCRCKSDKEACSL